MKTFIIAEAGINHEGGYYRAEQLVLAAKNAGADAVKFQSFIPETIALDDKECEELKQYQMGESLHQDLKNYCDGIGIEFMSTPFCPDTAQMLNDLGVKRFKISSGNITNIPLLQKVASFGKPVILSCGMANFLEIKDAREELKKVDLTLLYCRSMYPASEGNIRLGNMAHLMWEGDFGLSDHTKSTLVPALAVAVGAKVVEKHLTLWPDREGADHHMSMDEDGFKEMVQNIRRTEVIMQQGPAMTKEEAILRSIWRRKVEHQRTA